MGGQRNLVKQGDFGSRNLFDVTQNYLSVAPCCSNPCLDTGAANEGASIPVFWADLSARTEHFITPYAADCEMGPRTLLEGRKLKIVTIG